MKEEKTIQITICDKCGEEVISQVFNGAGMDLCETCFDKWEEFLRKKTAPVLDQYFQDNPNLKEDFKKLK